MSEFKPLEPRNLGHFTDADCNTEPDKLLEAAKKLLERADWKVGGALTPESKRSDFQSNGISYVKTRDLARLRDAVLKATGETS